CRSGSRSGNNSMEQSHHKLVFRLTLAALFLFFAVLVHPQATYAESDARIGAPQGTPDAVINSCNNIYGAGGTFGLSGVDKRVITTTGTNGVYACRLNLTSDGGIWWQAYLDESGDYKEIRPGVAAERTPGYVGQFFGNSNTTYSAADLNSTSSTSLAPGPVN